MSRPLAYGIPYRYRRRERTEREKLIAAGWCKTGKWWVHERYADVMCTTGEALTYQAAWDAKRRAEVA